MMTKDAAVSEIVSNITLLRDIEDSKDLAKLTVFASRYYDSACAITGYRTLPDSLLSFVEDATLQAWMKRGAEGMNMQTAAGISEQYIDVEYALRTNLKAKHNPMATTVTQEVTSNA